MACNERPCRISGKEELKNIEQDQEYRRNRKIAKKEIAAIAATALPLIRTVTSKSADITNFVTRLAEESKNIEGEQLVQMILDNISGILKTDNNRIIEIFTYMAGLSPSDMNNILVHSISETMKKD